MDSLSMDETVNIIASRIASRKFTQHVVVNVAKLVNMRNDPVLKKSVESCDIVNIDGMGVVWGARLLGYPVPERVSGIDLFYNLLRLSAEKGFSVFLLGAKEEIVVEAKRRVELLYPKLNVAGYHNGYFWDNEQDVVDKINKSGARLLFVAISSPKKENFINKWHRQWGVDFVMGVGGTFDVVAGKVKRAPLWMQKYGLEWLYRVYQEPRRMFKRYLSTNTKFLFFLVKEMFKPLKDQP